MFKDTRTDIRNSIQKCISSDKKKNEEASAGTRAAPDRYYSIVQIEQSVDDPITGNNAYLIVSKTALGWVGRSCIKHDVT